MLQKESIYTKYLCLLSQKNYFSGLSTLGTQTRCDPKIPPHSLHRGQNPLHLWTTSPPSRIIGYPPIFRHFLTPSILWHLSLSLFVCKYFNLYKTLLWTYDEGCQGMEVLSIRQKKLMQFSLKYLFEKTKLCTTK